MQKGLGWLKGRISPHYNERVADFDEVMLALGKGACVGRSSSVRMDMGRSEWKR